MNALARRRLAGWSALLLIMSVVPLLALPAGADHETPLFVEGNPSCQNLTDGGTEFKIEPVSSGQHSDGVLTVDITVNDTSSGQEFDWSANFGVDVVVVKGGPDANVYFYNPISTSDTGLHAPLNPNNSKWYGLSHISFCYFVESLPSVAVVAGTGACNFDEEVFEVTVSQVSNATLSVDLNGDGDFGDAGESDVGVGTYAVTAGVGGLVAWEAVADEGAEFSGGLTTLSGDFEVADCSNPPPSVSSVSVSAACDLDEEVFEVTVSQVSNATLSVDLNGDGDFGDAGESDVGVGTYAVTAGVGGLVAWEAVADEGAEFSGGLTTLSGDFEVADCTSTPPATLPPGSDSVIVSAAGVCEVDPNGKGFGKITVVVNPANGATVSVPGATALGSGVFRVPEGSVWTWSATANTGYAIQGNASGGGQIGTCSVEVLGTTIATTVSTVVVSPATLPFTGPTGAGSALAIGMALAGLGGLVLAAVKREEEEEARASL